MERTGPPDGDPSDSLDASKQTSGVLHVSSAMACEIVEAQWASEPCKDTLCRHLGHTFTSLKALTFDPPRREFSCSRPTCRLFCCSPLLSASHSSLLPSLRSPVRGASTGRNKLPQIRNRTGADTGTNRFPIKYFLTYDVHRFRHRNHLLVPMHWRTNRLACWLLRWCSSSALSLLLMRVWRGGLDWD